MRILSLFALVLCTAAVATADSKGAAKPTVEAAKPMKHQFDERYTDMRLEVRHPKLRLLKLSQEKSSLEGFTDDTGTDLRVEPTRRRPSGLEGRPWFDDPHLAHVYVRGDAVSAKATSIRAKGKIVFLAASARKGLRSELSAFKAGHKIKVGDYTFHIRSFMKQPDEPKDSKARTVSFTLDREAWEIATIRFLDEHGMVIPAESYGGGTSRVFGVTTVSFNYHLKRIPEKVHIDIEVWDDIREVVLPFDLTQKVVR